MRTSHKAKVSNKAYGQSDMLFFSAMMLDFPPPNG
jgi:hypothetical protein